MSLVGLNIAQLLCTPLSNMVKPLVACGALPTSPSLGITGVSGVSAYRQLCALSASSAALVAADGQCQCQLCWPFLRTY